MCVFQETALMGTAVRRRVAQLVSHVAFLAALGPAAMMLLTPLMQGARQLGLQRVDSMANVTVLVDVPSRAPRKFAQRKSVRGQLSHQQVFVMEQQQPVHHQLAQTVCCPSAAWIRRLVGRVVLA
jgi:hypothetical protein